MVLGMSGTLAPDAMLAAATPMSCSRPRFAVIAPGADVGPTTDFSRPEAASQDDRRAEGEPSSASSNSQSRPFSTPAGQATLPMSPVTP